jgi:FkbM family methyltransferase
MLSGIRKTSVAILPEKAKDIAKSIFRDHFDGYASKFYSQEGEDMILRSIFYGRDFGFYVDVGAHHPKRFSNTYFFYKLGWQGINLDPLPGCMDGFRKQRPRDISLELAISDKKEKLTYYLFDEPAFNGFSKNISEERNGKTGCRVVSKLIFETRTLAEILELYLPTNQEIDFLSIDVEGYELKVLRSNDWQRYSPEIVLIEILDTELSEVANNPVYQFMINQGYRLFAKLVKTYVFQHVKHGPAPFPKDLK